MSTMNTTDNGQELFQFIPQDDYFVDSLITTITTFLLSLLVNMEFYLVIYYLINVCSFYFLKPEVSEFSTTNYSTNYSTNQLSGSTKWRGSKSEIWLNLFERVICFIASLIALVGLLISKSFLVLGFITLVALIYITKVYTCIRGKCLNC